MGKKRRVLWVGGWAVCFVVLAFATAMLIAMNSPDARLERAIREIVAGHKFEYEGDNVGYMRGSNKEVLSDIYGGRPLGPEDEKRIVTQLRQACPKCSFVVVTVGDDYLPATSASGEPTYDINLWLPPAGSAISDIMVIFDDKGLGDEDDMPSSRFVVSRYREQNRWPFLKSLWPW